MHCGLWAAELPFRLTPDPGHRPTPHAPRPALHAPRHAGLMGGSWFVALDMELTPASHCLVRCSYVWSVSVYDLFPVTMVGGTLFIPPRGGHMNVQYIAETIAKETIDAVVIQPTLLNLLLDEHAADPGFGNFGMIIAALVSSSPATTYRRVLSC